MKIIGLTGGIGAGKSTVASFFKELGVPVYTSDIEAKRLMNSSTKIKRALIKEFGEKAYRENTLNRAFLASVVFNDQKKLAAINAIVHPSVSNSFKRWVTKQKTPYVIQENAILFESNTADKYDYIITVTAPLEERIIRVIKRDSTTRAHVLARIDNQISDNDKIRNAHFVIHAIDKVSTKKEVLRIHQRLLELSN